MRKISAKGFITVLSTVPITNDLITLPASQRAHVFTVIIQYIPFIYTYFISKNHYLPLHHPTFVIFPEGPLMIDYRIFFGIFCDTKGR